jgi:hypothetical protein
MRTITKDIIKTATTESGGIPGSSQYLKLIDNFKTIAHIELPDEPINVVYTDGTNAPMDSGALVFDQLMNDETKFLSSGQSGGFTHGVVRKIHFPAFEKTPFELKGGREKTAKNGVQTPVYLQSSTGYRESVLDASSIGGREFLRLKDALPKKPTLSELNNFITELEALVWSETNKQTYSNMLADEQGAVSIAEQFGFELGTSIKLIEDTKVFSGTLTKIDLEQYSNLAAQVTILKEPTFSNLTFEFSLK